MTTRLFAVMCLSACVTTSSSEHIAYIPSPEAVVNPQEVIERVIAKTPGATVTFAADSLTTHQTIDGAPTTQLVRYDRIEKVEMFSQTNNDAKVFGVLLSDKQLRSMFQWAAANKEDAQKMADAISVLAAASVENHAKP